MTRPKTIKRVLVAGASGKLGCRLVPRLLQAGYEVRTLVHKTPVNIAGVQSMRGNVSDPASMRKAVDGVDAICQLATTKEDPRTFIDVSVRGTYNLLEAARQCGTVQRWILSGGDAAMGIYFHPQSGPINEAMPHRAYPGCYALSKVLEEVLGQQYYIQYGLPYVGLRASWIMDDDDILRHMTVGAKQFGVPRWRKHMTAAQLKSLKDGRDRAPIGLHPDGRPIIRHVVHVQDVVSAFLLALANPASVGQTFNVAAPSAFAYDVAGEYLSRQTGLPTMRIKVPDAQDFAIDISKARAILGYQPQYDIFRIIDAALEHRTAPVR